MIVALKRCITPPSDLETFDSGAIAVDPPTAYQVIADDVNGWLFGGLPVPPPFDDCDPGSSAYAADGFSCWAFASSSGPDFFANGIYVTPIRLKPGVWTLTITITPTSSNELPSEDYQNVWITFQAVNMLFPDGPALTFTVVDGDPLTFDIEAWINPFIGSTDDPCSCALPDRPLLYFTPSKFMAQTCTIQITGAWVSDIPP